MKRLLNWLDNNILTIFCFFLIAFIPLYPKFPLFEAIPGYIVRIRLEDIFILIAFLVFLIQVIRKKAVFKSIIFWPMIIYIIVGLLSSFSAVFLIKTVPLSKIHLIKLVLHWLRRIEYFSIFYLFLNGIKNIKDLKKLFFFILLVVSGVAVYGYGQKYLYWPVYSTMNREFSKGIRLYLTEHARVPSTFGGHYDLAAFLVIFLTLFLSLFFVFKKNKQRWLYLIAYLLSYWLLILTASRTSFIAYIGAVTVLLFVLSLKKKNFIKGFLWGGVRWLSIIIFSFFIMISFGDLSDRFAQILKITDLKKKLALDNLIRPIKPKPPNSISLSGDLGLVMDKTDERPVAKKPVKKGVNNEVKKELPPDVYKDIPNGYEKATISSGLTETVSVKLVPKKRTFSKNAYKYGLSSAIRMDALWPRALAGFKKNPLLGSGYSTLTKKTVGQFTEAESTDNDYLRILGETGILGFVSFFTIIFLLLKTSALALKKESNRFIVAFLAAFIAFTVGLLINALYIDVFEASKVAYMFWAFAGIMLAVCKKNRRINSARAKFYSSQL